MGYTFDTRGWFKRPRVESRACLGVAADPVAVGVESVGVAARDPDRTADLTAVEVLDHGQTR